MMSAVPSVAINAFTRSLVMMRPFISPTPAPTASTAPMPSGIEAASPPITVAATMVETLIR